MRNNEEKSKQVKRKRKRPSAPNAPRPEQEQPRTRQPNYTDYAKGTYYSKPNIPVKRPSQRPSQRPGERPYQSKAIPLRKDPPKQKRRIKKKKAKFFVGRLIFLIGFIIGIIYLISIVLETSQKPAISYQSVQTGVIDNSDLFEGIIVRNEQVIKNSKQGNMYLIAGEGDKIKKNGQVYQILDPLEAAILEKDIQNVESDIEKVQDKRDGISYLQNEIQAINNNINTSMEIYYAQTKPGVLQETHELKKQLEHDIAKRKSVHMKDNAAALNELQGQKEDLSVRVSGNETIYKALEPGIISYYMDGAEDKFAPDKIDQITEKDIKEKYKSISTTANQIIEANAPAYRIIKDNTWKVVCFMPESWAENFKPGQKHEFTLIDDNSVEFTLKVEENTPQEKNHKVVFTSNEQLDAFANARTISFKSLQYMYEGLKIPNSAVTERNLIKLPSEYIVASEDGKGVMKSSGVAGESVFLKLDVQYADENGYTHILQKIGQNEGLKLGDTISHPSNADKLYAVSEVSTVKGVYAVNGRITRFKPVEIVAQNEEHLIVTSYSSNGLKQFDQIVTNPKNIQEEELLRNMDVQNIR